jgi:hypothetical protein
LPPGRIRLKNSARIPIGSPDPFRNVSGQRDNLTLSIHPRPVAAVGSRHLAKSIGPLLLTEIMRLHPGLSIDGLWGRARPPMLASKTSPTLSARRREAYQSIGEIAPPRVESPRVPKIPHSFCARLKLFDRKALLSARPILLSAPLLCTRICIDCRTFPSRTPPFPPFPWISLDSLVRIETYQWVTRHKASKSFSRRFFRRERPEWEPAVLT